MNAKETFPPFQISVTEATFEINSQLLIDLNYTYQFPICVFMAQNVLREEPHNEI